MPASRPHRLSTASISADLPPATPLSRYLLALLFVSHLLDSSWQVALIQSIYFLLLLPVALSGQTEAEVRATCPILGDKGKYVKAGQGARRDAWLKQHFRVGHGIAQHEVPCFFVRLERLVMSGCPLALFYLAAS